jgi:hypothetical protein
MIKALKNKEWRTIAKLYNGQLGKQLIQNMQKILKNFLKHTLRNNLMFIFLFFNSTIIAQKIKIIDSLSFSDNIEKKYILYVKDNSSNKNRLVEIYSFIKNRKSLITQNRKIVPCEECGGMRGDPYIAITKNKNIGFTIYLDNNEIKFKCSNNNLILVSSQFNEVLQTEVHKNKEKIKTKMIVYKPKEIIYFKNYSNEILRKKCFKISIINE